jgi:hypothetical protein
MNKKTVIISILALFILAAGVGFWKWKKDEMKKQEELRVQAEERKKEELVKQEQTGEIDTSNWKIYKNDKYGLEFKYPEDWNVIFGGAPDIGGEWIYLTPEKDTCCNKLRFDVGIFNSEKSPKDWYKDNIENPEGNINYKNAEDLVINNNQAYYIKKEVDKYPNVNDSSYIDHFYIISNKNTVLFVQFREILKLYKDDGRDIEKEYVYSKYVPDFEKVARSIQVGIN